jgi:hypothetical protein
MDGDDAVMGGKAWLRVYHGIGFRFKVRERE